MTESRVTPGSMEPVSGLVMTSPSMTKNMFMVPTSSMLFLSQASSHSTWVKPLAWASSAASRLAA